MIINILNELSSTNSSIKKKEILEKNSGNDTLKNCFRLAYHKGIMFGIKKFPDAISSRNTVSLDEALSFLEDILSTRKITGNAAINALSEVIAGMQPGDVEVIRRVIARDLDCGVGKTIANKVWKNIIPAQPQMLASACSDKTLANIKYPAYAQLKADGARGFAEVRGTTIEDVTILSRAGNEYFGLDSIKRELIKAVGNDLEKYPGGIMIDGEFVYHENKKSQGLDFLLGSESDETSTVSDRSKSNGISNKSLKNTITKEEADNMIFEVWDYVPLDVVYGISEDPSLTYDVRLKHLENAVNGCPKLKLISTDIVNNLAEARAVYKKYVDMGLEGSILKNILSLWENKRSKNLVKFKEVFTVDMKVTGYYVHRKDPSKLGGVSIESECGNIKLNCGSGFTDTTHIKDSDNN